MRRLAFGILMLASTSLGHAQTASRSDDQVKSEILDLFQQLVDATRKQDRAALARLHTPEFVFIHRLAYVDRLEEHLDDVVAGVQPAWWGNAGPFRGFGPPNEFHIYGDVAVLRAFNPSGVLGPQPTVFTSIYVRREERWQVAQIQVSLLQPERQAVPVPVAVLDTYVGRYEVGDGGFAIVTREGDALFTKGRINARRKLTPTADGQFFDKVGGEWTFVRGADGKVTHSILRTADGSERRATKVE